MVVNGDAFPLNTSDPIEVFSDGSVSPSTMGNLASSDVGTTFVGRIIVLIPKLDYALLEQVKEGVLTSKGNPDSTRVEILAALRAKEICDEKGIANYMILTDSQGAAEQSKVEGVTYVERGRVHFASLFLDRIMNRARYLRHSSRKVLNRARPTKLQEELYQMFISEKSEITLSKSLLWQKIQMEMPAADKGQN